jgi:5-methylcytosine-specific restriction protein A
MSPYAPPRACTFPGCPNYCEPYSDYCSAHKRKSSKLYDKYRGSARQRGYDNTWHKLSNMKLRKNPMCECEECKGQGKIADMVHHIKSVEEYPELRLELGNLLSMNGECHNKLHKSYNGSQR